MTTLTDSNILIDISGRDPKWWEWSLARLQEAIGRGPVFINDVVYAESSIRYETVGQFDRALTRSGISMAIIPHAALFLAGKVFKQYRQASGLKTGVLPDFFIGAHAAVAGLTLLTRDRRR